MLSSHVAPVLPTGKQMRDLDLAPAVVEQIETLAQQILQRHLGPMMQRRRGQQARRQLFHHLVESVYKYSDLESAVEHAWAFTSALGQCLPGLDEEELARILKYKAAAASGSGAGSTSRLLSGVLAEESSTSPGDAETSGAEEDGADDEVRNRSQTRAPGTDDDSEADHDSSQNENGDDGQTASTPSSKPPRPTPPAMSPDLTASRGPFSSSPHARPTPSAAPPQSSFHVDVEALATVRDALRRLIKERVRFTAYLEGEKIQWAHEPASQVLVLVTGSVLRAAPHPAAPAHHHGATHNALFHGTATTNARSRLASAPYSPMSGGSGAHGRRDSGRLGGAASGLASGTAAGDVSGDSLRRPSSALDAQVRMAATQSDGAATDSSHSRRTSTVLQGIAAAVAASKLGDVSEETLVAPLVLGEASCLGHFPCCADIVVNAPVAVIASIAKRDYVSLVESAPRSVQQQLLSLALQEREQLLPYYAPMTMGRLRLCPLLQNLRRDQLEGLLDYVQPRVFPANTVCSERSEPQHLFFIRRGAVRMEREQGEPSALSAQSYLHVPRSRALLVDGHTYGEAACIFRESLEGTFFAINHVDVYMLPFAALIQLMKQSPDVQTKVYDGARHLTAARDREVPGFLFRPPEGSVAEGTVTGLQGVVPSSSVLFKRYANTAHRSQQPQQQLLQHSASLSVSGIGGDTRRVSFAVGEDSIGAQNNNSYSGNTTTAPPTGTGASANTTANESGAVTAMVEAMRQIPLLSLVGTTPFFNDLAQCWRRRHVEKGEFIVRRGEECNSLVLFCEGKAAVIVDEQRYQSDLRCSPFGILDVDHISFAALAVVPPGFAAGYTCTRRHRWTRTVVALDDNVEVLEVTRAVLVQLLQRHNLERALSGAALQIMQPLCAVFSFGASSTSRRGSAGAQRPTSAGGLSGPAPPPSLASRHGSVYSAGSGLATTASAAGEISCPRAMSLDYQPLLQPMPNSLWVCHPIPNLHPVVTSEFIGTARDRVLFPLWKDGDFPLPRVSATAGGGEAIGMYSSNQSMVSTSRPLSRRATRNNFQTPTDISSTGTPGLRGNQRLDAVFDGTGAGSGASSPIASAALARADFQRRVQQEVV